MKSTNISICALGTLNQLFIRGSYAQVKFTLKLNYINLPNFQWLSYEKILISEFFKKFLVPFFRGTCAPSVVFKMKALRISVLL